MLFLFFLILDFHCFVVLIGGLRYHGMAPLISHVYEQGFMEAISIPQIECFQGDTISQLSIPKINILLILLPSIFAFDCSSHFLI